MKPREAQEVVNRMQYKPGWRIIAEPARGMWSDGDLMTVTLEMETVDAYDPHRTTIFRSAEIYYNLEHMHEEALVRAVFNQIQRAEMHEAAEFFTYENVRVFDPHKSILNVGGFYDLES